MQAQFKGVNLATSRLRAIEEFRAVSSLVDTKAPEDAAGFKAGSAMLHKRQRRLALRAAS